MREVKTIVTYRRNLYDGLTVEQAAYLGLSRAIRIMNRAVNPNGTYASTTSPCVSKLIKIREVFFMSRLKAGISAHTDEIYKRDNFWVDMEY